MVRLAPGRVAVQRTMATVQTRLSQGIQSRAWASQLSPTTPTTSAPLPQSMM